jgi:hypothetical protein
VEDSQELPQRGGIKVGRHADDTTAAQDDFERCGGRAHADGKEGGPAVGAVAVALWGPPRRLASASRLRPRRLRLGEPPPKVERRLRQALQGAEGPDALAALSPLLQEPLPKVFFAAIASPRHSPALPDALSGKPA